MPAAVVAAALVPASAPADVLLDPLLVGGEVAAGHAATLVGPDGSWRTLAAPGGGIRDRFQVSAVSPDHRVVARTSGRRVVLVPTDGGRPRVLGLRGLRVPAPERQAAPDPGIGDPDGSFGFGLSVGGTPAVWWDADGSHVRRDAVRSPAGTPVVVTCTVASGRCSSRRSPRGLQRVAARGDGGSLWTGTTPPDVEQLVSLGPLADGTWVRATPAAVRRARAVLRRPHPDALVLVTPAGTERTLWSTRRSYAQGVTDTAPSEGGPGGTIVAWDRTTYALQTRRRKGRPQARLRVRTVAEGLWRIAPSGRRSTFRARTTAGDRLESVDGPAGPHGWYGTVRDRRGRALPATVDARGVVRRVLLDGRPPTVGAIQAALGLGALPAAGSDGTGGGPRDVVGVSGYEAATDSLIATYTVGPVEDLRQVVARLPVAGGPPSPVLPRPGSPAGDPRLVIATAW
ncbi:hypothetical protein AB0L40_18860 [Patulibacter sp. NPDC049589]|uniref:hypothetical protein n=1 Tax=Patulibacter sp. NPDC049589 TaxID=3154731 RepID=UPI003444F664